MTGTPPATPKQRLEAAAELLQRGQFDRAGELAASVLEELNLASLSTPADLRLFASALASRGGFASAVAALLTLHAAMYDGEGLRRSVVLYPKDYKGEARPAFRARR